MEEDVYVCKSQSVGVQVLPTCMRLLQLMMFYLQPHKPLYNKHTLVH